MEGHERYLAAELAGVLGVLSDLSLLDLLTERGTVACTVLTSDADLSSSTTLTRRAQRRGEENLSMILSHHGYENKR